MIGKKISSYVEKIFTTLPYGFITWISHFATLLISSIIIILILNSSFEQVTIHTISSLNAELTNYVEKTSSQIQDMLKYYGYYTFYSPSVTKLRQSKELSNFEVISGIRDLNALVSTSTYVHSVYVYNANKQYIYSTNESGSNTPANFPDTSAVQLFLDGVSENSFELIYRIANHKSPNNANHIYSYILYESENGVDYDNALMINLYENEYNDSFFGVNFKKEMLLVKDTGQVIVKSGIPASASTEPQPAIMKNILESGNGNGYIIDKSRNDKMIYLYSYMSESGRYFIRLLKYDELTGSLGSIKKLSFLVIAVIFLSGCIISLIMLNRIYLPLKKIIYSLSGNNNAKLQQNSDSILKNLDFWVKDQIHDKQEYLSLIKQEFLKQVLTSPVSPVKNIEENFLQYEIDLQMNSEVYLILVKGISPGMGVSAIKTAFSSIHVEGMILDGFSVLLVQPSIYAAMDDICKHILGLGANYCGYSCPINNYHEINQAYIHMKELYALRIFYPNTLLFTENILDAKSKENIYPDQQEIKIIQALRSGKLELAEKQYHEWLESVACHRYNIIIFAYKRLYLTIYSLHQLIVTSSASPSFPADMDFIENKFKSIDDIKEINQTFYELFAEICDKVTVDKLRKNDRTVQKIKEIIESGFTSPNLSPQTISNLLNLSDLYIGKLFRSVEKCSINDYINKIRIQHAQTLLSDSNLTVKEVAQKVGFENLTYFYTLFKNYSHVSPAVFRQTPGKNADE